MQKRVTGPLDKLIEATGGVSKLANVLGVNRTSILTWQDKDPEVQDKLKINILCRALNLEEIYKE